MLPDGFAGLVFAVLFGIAGIVLVVWVVRRAVRARTAQIDEEQIGARHPGAVTAIVRGDLAPGSTTLVADSSGISFWTTGSTDGAVTDTPVRSLPWAGIRSVEAGMLFLQRPTNSLVIVGTDRSGAETRIEVIPYDRGTVTALPLDDGELRELIDRIRAQRPAR